MTALAIKWMSQFFAALGDDRLAADELKDAFVRSDLARWTATLTGVVVHSFEQLGWAAAGKGHRCTVLPVKRNEYLSQDVMAFPALGPGWRFPVAVCELENSADADLVSYSLWKVLCVRCGLRILFCYRPDSAEGPRVRRLARQRLRGRDAHRGARGARWRDAGGCRFAQRRGHVPLRILSDVEAQLQHGAFRALRAALK